MGVDVTLNRHGSGLMNSQATDDNADIIEGGFAETLSRDNSINNAMNVDLDMNGNNIINASSIQFETLLLESYSVAALPTGTNAGEMIYVSDETGGAVPAFFDGVDWRRVTDRAIVS